MMHSLALAWTILEHKWHVAAVGLRLKVPWWRLLLHDLGKFGPAEFGGYRRRFQEKADDPGGLDFKRAWEHHLKRNPHHWQFYLRGGGPTPMPDTCVREMLADWVGAGRAYAGSAPRVDAWPWLRDNLPRMNLHDVTFERLACALHDLGASRRTVDNLRAARLRVERRGAAGLSRPINEVPYRN